MTYSLSFFLGLSVSRYQLFPYNLIVNFKDLFIDNNKNRVTSDLFKRKKFNIDNIPEKKIFLTYGQSNSANHGQIGYETKSNTYMFFKGKLFRYEDPVLGASGGNDYV